MILAGIHTTGDSLALAIGLALICLIVSAAVYLDRGDGGGMG